MNCEENCRKKSNLLKKLAFAEVFNLGSCYQVTLQSKTYFGCKVRVFKIENERSKRRLKWENVRKKVPKCIYLVSGGETQMMVVNWVSRDFPSSFGICNQRYRIISMVAAISSTRGLCMCQHQQHHWSADQESWKIQWFFPLSINWVTSIVWLNRGLQQKLAISLL